MRLLEILKTAFAEQNPTNPTGEESFPEEGTYDSMPTLEAMAQPIQIASAEQTQVRSFAFTLRRVRKRIK